MFVFFVYLLTYYTLCFIEFLYYALVFWSSKGFLGVLGASLLIWYLGRGVDCRHVGVFCWNCGSVRKTRRRRAVGVRLGKFLLECWGSMHKWLNWKSWCSHWEATFCWRGGYVASAGTGGFFQICGWDPFIFS